MTQEERLLYLIKYLLSEFAQRTPFDIPAEVTEQRRLLRSLMNIRPAKETHSVGVNPVLPDLRRAYGHEPARGQYLCRG